MAAPDDSPSSVRKAALITGASSGIGRAVALQLAAAGYAVALNARRVELLDELARQVRVSGGTALVLPGDARDAAVVGALVADTRSRFGRLDAVVGSAGVYLRKPVLDTTRDDVEAMLQANFWSVFELARAVSPGFVEQASGHLVVIASFDAVKGMPHDGAYVAAKSAVRGYLGVLRQDLARRGVQVTTILPGRVDTAMVEGLRVPAVSAKIPPERVARAVVRALRRRGTEVVVPWHCRALQWVDVVSPRTADWLVRVLGLDGRPES